MKATNSNGSLNLVAKSWEKDANGLFDYTNKNVKNSKESIQTSTCLTRKDNYIKSKQNDNIQQNEEFLFNITKKEGNKYLIENNLDINMEPSEENISKINNKPWYVVNDCPISDDHNKIKNKNKNYYLVKNDIIKLGRIKLVLIEESLYSGDKRYELNVPNQASSINIENSKGPNIFNMVRDAQSLNKENTEEKILCRICYLEEENKEDNPMVHLCNCKGAINYAHFNCIKHWMKTKLIVLQNANKTVKTYYIPRFNCEICKSPYPFRFKLPGRENHFYELIDIVRPNNNYIIFESLDQVKEKNNNKYIHVVSLVNQNDIIIGRGIDADIKINDISVSRLHTKLNFDFEKKSLLITDLKSKFGTLILIKNPFEIKEKESLNIQIGRTFIKAGVTRSYKKKIFSSIKEEKTDYKIVKEEFKNSLNDINDNFGSLDLAKVNSQTSLDNENKNFKENNDTQKHIGENEESVNESIDMEIEIR